MSGNNHTLIFENAMSLLAREKPEAYKFLNAYRGESGQGKKTLEQYVREPDETEGFMGTHQYYVNTRPSLKGKYYKNQNCRYSPSARTRLEEHYFAAVNAYKSGDTEYAIKRLGYAVHYLQDIGATPHSVNILWGSIKNIGDMHCDFERYANKEWNKYKTGTAKDYYGCFSKSFEQPINKFAETTGQKKFAKYFKKIYLSFSRKAQARKIQNYDTILSVAVPLTEKYTAALLQQFYTDTHLQT